MQTGAKQSEPTQVAWAAGFIDGEGYVGVTRNFNELRGQQRIYYRIMLAVGQVHRSPVEVLQSMFGGRIVYRKNAHRNFWDWRVFGENAREAVRILMPYLIVKRKQAELVLEFDAVSRPRDGKSRYRELPADVYERRKAIWVALVELNGGRATRAERLSEEAPLETADGAIVRPGGKGNHQSCSETNSRLLQ